MSKSGRAPPQSQNPMVAALQAKFMQGVTAFQQGRIAEAEKILGEILQQHPKHFDALHLLGIIAIQTRRAKHGNELIKKAIELDSTFAEAHNNLGIGLRDLNNPEEALASYNKAIALKRDFADAYNNRGNTLLDLKRHEEALASYDKAIALKPNYAEAYNNRGSVLNDLKRHDEALASYDKAIALKPNYAEAYNNRGSALNDLKRHDEALASYDKAIALNPNYAEAYYNYGNALKELNRSNKAIASYDKAITLKPDYVKAWLGRGNVFYDLKRYNEAFAAYDKALAIKPDLEGAWLGRGNVFYDLKRCDEAFAAYGKALAIKPDLAEAWLGRGNVFYDLKRYDEAFAAHDKALSIKPDLENAWLGRGNVFFDLKRYDEAFAAYAKALAIKPDVEAAWLGRGNVFHKLKRHDEAANAYAKLLKINPNFPFAKGKFFHQKMLCCDWNGVNELIADIDNDIISGKLSAEPFGWQGVAKSQRSLQLCAELFNKHEYPVRIGSISHKPLTHHKIIRLGYSSGEFRDQATSHLIVGILELHDKLRFEVYAIDNGWDDKSEIRRRINASVNGIIDISKLSDSSAAAAIYENHIDILVNLNGYFGEERTRVFAQRPAPIQVNYLGFPGTLGASYMDYIIADQHVIPPNHKEFYTEKLVCLPNCYQANDRKKAIGARIFSRIECGLPERGFVFCCFNNHYKILPETFETWMRILKQVEGSVLWLIEDNGTAASNLRKEAEARGVNAERLIFAKRIPLPDHLARHRLADLFLDTLPYNAHTTASDALWSGLPVLTCLGETFAGRVAASLLNAIRLPELITTSAEAYEQKAIDLAINSEKLALIKRKLADHRLTTPLFDTKLFTKHIEAAYTAMYARHQAGLEPDHIVVPN